jgi:hypothetical protein
LGIDASCEPCRLARNNDLDAGVRQSNATGKSLLFCRILSSTKIKNISLFPKREPWHIPPVSPGKRGVAHVTNAR